MERKARFLIPNYRSLTDRCTARKLNIILIPKTAGRLYKDEQASIPEALTIERKSDSKTDSEYNIQKRKQEKECSDTDIQLAIYVIKLIPDSGDLIIQCIDCK